MRQVATFLGPADASRLLGVTPASIRLMVQRGDLQVAAMTESGVRLFNRADVEALAQRRASNRKEIKNNGEEAL